MHYRPGLTRPAPPVTRRKHRPGTITGMDKQQEFVLRTLEERDIRFVRLWFTDVLGLPEVGGRGAGRARGRVRRGDRLRRLGDRGLRPGRRVGHAGQARPGDLPDPAVALRVAGHARGCSATSCCRTARRPTPTRARCSSGRWPRPPTSGFAFYTHPEIEFFLFRDQPERRAAPDAGRPGRLLRPHRARHRPRLPPGRDHDARERWGSRWSSATTRGRRASRRSTCATPTRSRPPTTS